MTEQHKQSDVRDLVLTRLINAPREAVWRCWTEPELLRQWFAPKPWSTPYAALDVRPGGVCLVTMAGPDGKEFANPGVYLEVVPNEKLVITDAYTRAWEPSAHPFMTTVLSFEDEGGGTRYTARVKHWTTADRERHEEMGFHDGWGRCADQLEQIARNLS